MFINPPVSASVVIADEYKGDDKPWQVSTSQALSSRGQCTVSTKYYNTVQKGNLLFYGQTGVEDNIGSDNTKKHC